MEQLHSPCLNKQTKTYFDKQNKLTLSNIELIFNTEDQYSTISKGWVPNWLFFFLVISSSDNKIIPISWAKMDISFGCVSLCYNDYNSTLPTIKYLLSSFRSKKYLFSLCLPGAYSLSSWYSLDII